MATDGQQAERQRQAMNGITTLEARHQAVLQRIRKAALAAGRDPASVRLLAVSKTFPADAVRALAGLGQRAFGENYLQEAQLKIAALADLAGAGSGSGSGSGIEWHFIGPIQSNKTGPIARNFDWVHSIERGSIAERLSRQRVESGREPLSVCIQVNVSGEASKSGCAPDDALALARTIGTLPGLILRGVMAIPEPSGDEELLRSRYREAARVLIEIRADQAAKADEEGGQSKRANTGLADTLSMGMSADIEPAVAEGATIVRVGSALFGARSMKT